MKSFSETCTQDALTTLITDEGSMDIDRCTTVGNQITCTSTCKTGFTGGGAKGEATCTTGIGAAPGITTKCTAPGIVWETRSSLLHFMVIKYWESHIRYWDLISWRWLRGFFYVVPEEGIWPGTFTRRRRKFVPASWYPNHLSVVQSLPFTITGYVNINQGYEYAFFFFLQYWKLKPVEH